MKRKNLGKVNLSDPNNPKIDLVSKGSFQADLKDFKDGQRVWLEVSTYYRQRTTAQNSLFHVYCQEIANDTGQDLETVKSTIKTKYAQKAMVDSDGNEIVDPNTGDVAMYVQDTKDMNTVEMATLTENTRMFALEFFGIHLPLPEEQTELKYK